MTFLKYIGYVFKKLFLIFFFQPFFSFSLNAGEDSYLLEGPLAGSFYYTKEKPGRWSKEIDSHLPSHEISQHILEISTLHEMKGYDHYIVKHIILDKKFNIISEKKFDPSREPPVSKHNILGYKGTIYILSICNKHDIWLKIIKI